MCGRYALHSLIGDLREHFGLFGELDFQPRYNIVPSLHLPVVRQGESGRELALCQWGLIPAWSKSMPKNRPINARAETVAEKPFFRGAFRRRRCLVPANGFYEWQRSGARKRPWYVRPRDAGLFAFAGIWDRWDDSGQTLDTFAIITTSASEAMRPIHDRMPVIVDADEYRPWLETGSPELLAPYAGELAACPVSARVNSPANEGRELIEPIRE